MESTVQQGRLVQLVLLEQLPFLVRVEQLPHLEQSPLWQMDSPGQLEPLVLLDLRDHWV